MFVGVISYLRGRARTKNMCFGTLAELFWCLQLKSTNLAILNMFSKEQGTKTYANDKLNSIGPGIEVLLS